MKSSQSITLKSTNIEGLKKEIESFYRQLRDDISKCVSSDDVKTGAVGSASQRIPINIAGVTKYISVHDAP